MRWAAPTDDGGCPVQDYAVYRDEDGTGAGPWTVVNTLARGDPGLREFECPSFPVAAALGDLFMFRIEAFNRQGSVVSTQSAPMLLAGVPAQPPAAPGPDPTLTSSQQIKVVYQEVSDDGGSAVLSYELQRGSPALNDWRSLVGEAPHTLALEHVVSSEIAAGEVYTFRYRAINQVGAGPWSDTMAIRAAGRPSAPAKPTLVACDAESVTLAFDQAGFANGGSEILSFKLLRDEGADSPASPLLIDTEVAAYDGQASSFQVTGLTAGVVYRFQYYATNAFGDSPGSAILSAAATQLADAPGSPQVDWDLSGSHSLYLRWAATSTGTLPEAPILGYLLQMDSGNATWATVYDGAFRPGVLGRLVDGLVSGHLYTFRAIALNYNGQSAPSAPAAYYVCTAPSRFDKPVVEAQSKTGLLLRWEPPKELGGCRVTGYAVFRDGGEVASAATGAGITVELNSEADVDVRDKPSLNTLAATAFPADTEGQAFRLQVQVFTTQRTALSDVAHALLASVPGLPADVPVSDPSVTSSDALRVTFALPDAPDDGGSPILSYELQMDSGDGGDFISIHGFSPYSMATHYTATQNVSKGRTHRFRYRAKNAVGWGPFSAEASVLAASRPSRPEPPAFSSFSAGTLTVTITPSADNGGTALLGTELWIDAGDDFSSAFALVTGYDGVAPTYGLTEATDGLAPGGTYRLRTRSVNAVGASTDSIVAYVAFGDVPGAPGQPERVASTRTSLTVRWAAPAVAAGGLPVLGYVLNMDDGVHTHLAPVYIGNGRPDVLEHTVGDLVTGRPYLFSVQAISVNGYSPHSASASYYACVPPPLVAAPQYVASDAEALTITVEWQLPRDNGGCAVLGYRLYRTAGSSDAFDESEPATAVATLSAVDPGLTQHTVDLSAAGIVGDMYKFKIEAYNAAGATDSSALSVALASLPSQPPAMPYTEPTVTGPDQLGLRVDPIAAPLDGGSSILQYEVQYDDGARGPYKSVFTLSPLVVVTRGVLRGQDHRVQYRAMNFNGWGPYSEVAYITAAGIPQKPGPPTYLWSSSTEIALGLSPTPDDRGAPITTYELYIDTIQAAPAFELASSELTMTRVIEYAPPPTADADEVAAWLTAKAGTISATLVAGGHYRLVVRAVNQVGSSEASEELRVALAGLPSQPAAPYKVEEGSSESSLLIAWPEATDAAGVEIEGYTLYADDGRHGDLQPVFDGRLLPQTLSSLVSNLTTGLPYRFVVTAHTINGESPQSAIATVYACLKPSGLEAPTVTSTSRTSIGVAWNEPESNGCPVTGFTLLRNTGADDALTVSVDPLALQNRASLREHLITGLASISSTYRIKVRAHNYAGYFDSPPRVVVLAAVPDAPAAAPSSAADITDGTQIGLVYGPLTPAENGGSDVLSYEL